MILVGPQGSGRTTAANYLAQEHQRCLIKLDSLFDYWQKRGDELAVKAEEYLKVKAVELEEAIQEAEKKKKGKKKPRGEEDKELDAKEFRYLPKDLLGSMLRKRLQEDDCNAGAIFDQLTSEYWPDEKFAI